MSKGDPTGREKVTGYLGEVRFPTDRQGLVDGARRSGADETVLALLGRMEDRLYRGPAEVEEEAARLVAGRAGEAPVDLLSADSFPASDPPGYGAPGAGDKKGPRGPR